MSASDGPAIKGAQIGRPRNGLPDWKPYVWHDPDAGRQQEVEAILAGIRAQFADEPDTFDEPGPEDGYEWRREQLAELADVPVRADEPPPALAPAQEAKRCRKCGYLVTRCSCPQGRRP